MLGIAVPLDDKEILAAFLQTLTANGHREAVLRLTLTGGIGPRGVAPPDNHTPTLLITAATRIEPPATVCVIICRTTRRNEFSPLAAIKSLNYLDNVIARQEAVQQGAEDGILLNSRGHDVEATAANLFLRKGDKWMTPRLAGGALPGIFRARLMAADLVSEAQITEAELFSADDMCVGSALSVRSISTLDGQQLNAAPDVVAKIRAILETPD